MTNKMIYAELAEGARIHGLRDRRAAERVARAMQNLERDVRARLEPIAPSDVSAEFTAWLAMWLGKVSPPSAVARYRAAEEAADKATRRKREMYGAVKAAERHVMDSWHRAPRALKEQDAFRPPQPGYHGPVYEAKAAARAAVRADLRARWAAEDAEAAQQVELPAHITRLR